MNSEQQHFIFDPDTDPTDDFRKCILGLSGGCVGEMCFITESGRRIPLWLWREVGEFAKSLDNVILIRST